MRVPCESRLLPRDYMIKIKVATKKDFDGLLELHKELFNHNASLGDYDSRVNKKMIKFIAKWLNDALKDSKIRTLVAMDGDKYVGCISVTIRDGSFYTKAKKHGWVGRAYIKPRYRGMGLTSKMYEIVIKWLKSKNLKEARLAVNVHNKIAVQTWKHYGFKEDEVLMRLNL